MDSSSTAPTSPVRRLVAGERVQALRAAALVPPLLVVVILSVDAALARGPRSLVFMGPLDETGHLSTAAIVVLALVRLRSLVSHWREASVVLAASVLIDVDHIPLYLGVPHIAQGGRPYSHSLATPLVLVLLTVVMPAGRRRWTALVAAGVCLHFVRDIATGPGLTLWWPISDRTVLLPYRLYAGCVSVLAAVGALRLWRLS